MKTIRGLISTGIGLLAVVILAGAPGAHADVVTDANAKAADVVSRIPAPPITVRMMAIVQVSVFESVNAITGRYPAYRAKMTAAPGASVEAAVASATRTALLKLLPAQQAAIDADYQALLGRVPDGPAKVAGIAVGEQAANAIVALCADDGMVAPDVYRPHAAAGVYVPTVGPAVPHWGKRRPWAMTRGDQFRPGPPPSLTSDTWVRDYNEIKAIGSRNSTQRTPEQTAIAKFWEATAPAVYWPIARSVAAVPGREVTDNARLLAVAAMAMDDALIAVFDGKYTYNLWRPVTAIRNGDLDGNNATDRDPGWTPFIETPMHPEYPCAHCIVAGALGAVLEAEIGSGPTPTLSSASSTAGGAVRTWASVGDFTKEVAQARIYDGVHYRFSTEVGSAMGKKIGELAVKSVPRVNR
ncbi:MAG TPA: vanadium-dependent haloperoxidase [Candidatus Dormibacteraeota bacterium]|nr:vanadium-dependent haloperoxidase [Candidatus Dormibacteraeota bacterium]